MKKPIGSTLLLSAMVLVSFFGVACDTGGSEDDATLSGVVREAGTETPLPDITVALGNLETTTDQNGRFAFQEVPLGSMTLAVTTAGYDAYTQRIDVQEGNNSFDISLVRTQLFNLRFQSRTISVDDEAGAAFYKNIMQFQLLQSPGGLSDPQLFFAIGNQQELHVAPNRNSSLDRQKSVHMAYSVQDFDAYLSFLTDNEIDYGNYAGDSGAIEIRPDGVKQVYFQDPGRNWVEVNSVTRTQSIHLQFEHAAILVSDLERSAAFYKKILQFEEIETPFGPGKAVRFFSFGDHQELHLEVGNNSRKKLQHHAFAVQDFAAYVSFLRDNEIDYENWAGDSGAIEMRADGVRLIWFQDPDGNWLEVNDVN